VIIIYETIVLKNLNFTRFHKKLIILT